MGRRALRHARVRGLWCDVWVAGRRRVEDGGVWCGANGARRRGVELAAVWLLVYPCGAPMPTAASSRGTRVAVFSTVKRRRVAVDSPP